ncbi:MAG: ribulose-phosphate 3-epimerase [Bacillota bacterium]|nr:MAG: ribulose-phosphate 3-epimerase [Bacillota bacterium]
MESLTAPEPITGEVLIAPSVLSCDLARLAEQVRAVEQAGADWLHVDIMDGHFVPALTFGPAFVATLKRLTALPLDVHLMVDEPEWWVEPFVEAGASIVSFHAEACRHPRRLCRHLRSLGVKAGVALNPATPPCLLRYLSADVDLVVIMSVDPGFAGQPLLPETYAKLDELSTILRRALAGAPGAGAGASPTQPRPLVEVDGGVGPSNASHLVSAGAGVLVAGNSIFGRPDPARALGELRRAARP